MAGKTRPVLEVVYSTAPKTVYFLKDHLGSIRATVLDSATAPVMAYDDYDPWGYILPMRSKVYGGLGGSQAGNVAQNKFTGKEWDDEFGLNWNYFGARYYDPQIGRWMVVDPLAEKFHHFCPYVYGANNPLRFVDSDGRKLKDIPKQLGVLYAGLGATGAVIITNDVIGVGVLDDPLLVPVAGAAVVGTAVIVGANAIDEFINVFQQRSPQSQFPKRTDPTTAEKAKQDFAKSKQKEGMVTPAPPEDDKPPTEEDITKRSPDRKPTTKEKVKEVIAKTLELIDSLFGGGASAKVPPIIPPPPPPKEKDSQNER